MEKALIWSVIRAEDGKALHTYALFLRGCFNTMQNIGSVVELETTFNMKTIISKLPFKLRDRWRSVACEIQDKTKQRAKFLDIVQFIEKQAQIAIDPVFGDILDTSIKVAGKAQFKDSKQIRLQERGSSFVTTVANIGQSCDATKERNTRKSAFEKPCLFCNGDHTMQVCGKMKAVPNKERVSFFKAKGLCFGCLAKGHMSVQCQKRIICEICQQKHSTVLHHTEKRVPDKKDKEKENHSEATFSS
ncbi:MAG: hypothetical protein ACRCZO_00585, partial [Cetobacterium sp.]